MYAIWWFMICIFYNNIMRRGWLCIFSCWFFLLFVPREEKDKAIKSLKDEVRELREKEEEKLEEERKKVLDKIKKEVTAYQEEKMADLKKDNEKVGFTYHVTSDYWTFSAFIAK